MNKVIVILGPTAVGKTKLSIELAKRLDGEIINADSMQFYKGLDIGTAKIKEDEKEGIKHHLFDILDVNDDYSIYNYQKDGRIKIEEIFKRNKTPIVVGGTGLYIKALLYNYKFIESNNSDNYDDVSTEDLYNMLMKLDKSNNVDKNNRRRIIRAINYYKDTNSSISNNITNELLYDAIFIGLNTNRDILYDKINKRVDSMIDEGLIREVKGFYDKNIYSKPLINGIGYKEIYQYLNNVLDLDTAISNIKQNSRRYAKRQLTFFNNQLDVKWFNTNYDDFNITIDEVYNYLKNLN